MNWGENNRVDHFAVCHSAGCYTHANPVNPVILSSTSYVYDQYGRQIETIDVLNQSTYTVYDLRGNVVRQYGATYPVWYEYDVHGRMVAMATTRDTTLDPATVDSLDHPSLDVTRWDYDPATGLLLQKLYDDGKGPSYTYTPDGQLVTRTWARGVTTSYTYTNGSSLAAIDYSDETPSVSFTMDRFGRHKSITDATGTRAFTYNDALQLATETNALAVLSRTYDALGRPYGYQVTASEATAQAVSYAYSDMGRFSSLSSGVPSGSNTWNYSRLANSDLISGWSNGIIGTVKCFEGNRDLITQLRHAAGGTLISQFDYQNDELGRRTQRLDTGSAVATNLFAYDSCSQLTNAVTQTNVFTWVLDPIGNRVSATSNSATHEYTANALNQYEQITNGNIRSLAYDWDGNLTNDSVYAYVWDGENRLIKTESLSSVPDEFKVCVENVYDYAGRRVKKTVKDDYSGGTYSTTNVTTYIWNGWNIIAEMCDAGYTNYYTWGLDVADQRKGTLANRAGGVGGLLSMQRISGSSTNVYYYCMDGDGHVCQLVDEGGSIAASYEWSPFGKCLKATGSMALDNPFRWSTKYHDDETGLVMFQRRPYSSDLARWLSRDPLGEFAGLNRYAYLANNPLGSFDYLGLIDPEKTVEVLNKFLACKASHPDAYNWDAAIEYLLKKAYGKKWKKKLVKIADTMSKGLGATKYIPEKYEDAKDVLDKLYPEGVPFETKGLLDADLSKIASGIGKVQTAIDAVAILTEGSEDLTGADAVNLLSRVFDFSKSIGGSAPGIGSFLDYYSAAIKAATEGIKNIEDNLFKNEADIMMQSDCNCIDELSGGYHGVIKNLMKQLNKDK